MNNSELQYQIKENKINKSTDRPTLDFGLLKIRNGRYKNAQLSKDVISDEDFGRMTNEEKIQIIYGNNLEKKRALCKYFFKTNGIYSRATRYLSDMYKFDYIIYPNLDLQKTYSEEDSKKVLGGLNKILEYFDNSSIQQICRHWATKVCIDGSYYGYVCEDVKDRFVVQDLPIDYCRSRYTFRGIPMVEFNMAYFDNIRDPRDKERVLSLFPEEFKKHYREYKAGKLYPDSAGDRQGWVVLDVDNAFKFNLNEFDLPPFASAIPSIIQLGEIEDLNKEKLLQSLQKILVQKFSLDKNDQLPFHMNELERLNQNALDMVGDAFGVSVLSTVADVDIHDVGSDEKQGKEAVEQAENTAYNYLGISNNLFNTNGNLSMDKSIAIDESFVKPLILQFEFFFNNFIDKHFNKSSLKFRIKILNTTIFNYKDLSDKYKDLTKIGFGRFLPMVALGHSQKEIVSLAKLEQDMMDLDTLMMPPFSSNTMSSETWAEVQSQRGKSGSRIPQKNTNLNLDDSSDNVGRKELPDDQKSDKTIANRESMS